MKAASDRFRAIFGDELARVKLEELAAARSRIESSFNRISADFSTGFMTVGGTVLPGLASLAEALDPLDDSAGAVEQFGQMLQRVTFHFAKTFLGFTDDTMKDSKSLGKSISALIDKIETGATKFIDAFSGRDDSFISTIIRAVEGLVTFTSAVTSVSNGLLSAFKFLGIIETDDEKKVKTTTGSEVVLTRNSETVPITQQEYDSIKFSTGQAGGRDKQLADKSLALGKREPNLDASKVGVSQKDFIDKINIPAAIATTVAVLAANIGFGMLVNKAVSKTMSMTASAISGVFGKKVITGKLVGSALPKATAALPNIAGTAGKLATASKALVATTGKLAASSAAGYAAAAAAGYAAGTLLNNAPRMFGADSLSTNFLDLVMDDGSSLSKPVSEKAMAEARKKRLAREKANASLVTKSNANQPSPSTVNQTNEVTPTQTPATPATISDYMTELKTVNANILRNLSDIADKTNDKAVVAALRENTQLLEQIRNGNRNLNKTMSQS